MAPLTKQMEPQPRYNVILLKDQLKGMCIRESPEDMVENQVMLEAIFQEEFFHLPPAIMKTLQDVGYDGSKFNTPIDAKTLSKLNTACNDDTVTNKNFMGFTGKRGMSTSTASTGNTFSFFNDPNYKRPSLGASSNDTPLLINSEDKRVFDAEYFLDFLIKAQQNATTNAEVSEVIHKEYSQYDLTSVPNKIKRRMKIFGFEDSEVPLTFTKYDVGSIMAITREAARMEINTSKNSDPTMNALILLNELLTSKETSYGVVYMPQMDPQKIKNLPTEIQNKLNLMGINPTGIFSRPLSIFEIRELNALVRQHILAHKKRTPDNDILVNGIYDNLKSFRTTIQYARNHIVKKSEIRDSLTESIAEHKTQLPERILNALYQMGWNGVVFTSGVDDEDLQSLNLLCEKEMVSLKPSQHSNTMFNRFACSYMNCDKTGFAICTLCEKNICYHHTTIYGSHRYCDGCVQLENDSDDVATTRGEMCDYDNCMKRKTAVCNGCQYVYCNEHCPTKFCTYCSDDTQ